jgi:hypothetical protein
VLAAVLAVVVVVVLRPSAAATAADPAPGAATLLLAVAALLLARGCRSKGLVAEQVGGGGGSGSGSGGRLVGDGAGSCRSRAKERVGGVVCFLGFFVLGGSRRGAR